ncbi:MAG: riboflavin synthase [Betaproteobacteria bacterium]
MFTGIVEAGGRIAAILAQGDGVRLLVEVDALSVDDVRIGDSVAVNGCCLTVVALDKIPARMAFDVSAETLRCTAGLETGAEVNLEKALRLADRLGGHLMSGHVDGVGAVVAFDQVPANDPGPASWRVVIEAPSALARFIAAKGSIALQGVSLTVNAVAGTRFEVNLIPHTLAVTNLRLLTVGSQVNLEVDVVARYVERMITAST